MLSCVSCAHRHRCRGHHPRQSILFWRACRSPRTPLERSAETRVLTGAPVFIPAEGFCNTGADRSPNEEARRHSPRSAIGADDESSQGSRGAGEWCEGRTAEEGGAARLRQDRAERRSTRRANVRPCSSRSSSQCHVVLLLWVSLERPNGGYGRLISWKPPTDKRNAASTITAV
jgi:hypothetical protein